ncbi:glycoside hydrolase family 65 protein [Alteribacter aurantiacus]|uniref:glycoside hydrolase family 65 protein n=1 Tax=Alteribacter aurantiacus TaxID=254410 RepID=UPI0003FD9696|nr:glycosyl hydrolase family 65 protein [Alteribacter aurantiacus]
MESWTIENTSLNNQELLTNESLFSLGNGYIGVRGNFEEGYQEGMTSIRGTYLNAFHDITDIEYGEKLHGFPGKQQKLLNVIDAQTVEMHVNGERFSLFHGDLTDYKRTLNMKKGFVERSMKWKSNQGDVVKITSRKLVSFHTREFYTIEWTVEPLTSRPVDIKMVSRVNGDVANFSDPNDPRVASGHSKRSKVTGVKEANGCFVVENETYESCLKVACATSTSFYFDKYDYDFTLDNKGIEEVYTATINEPVSFVKSIVYTDTLRHGEQTVEKAIEILNEERHVPFYEHLKRQENDLNQFWSTADITISGDEELQKGIRFNLFHLLQSAGQDEVSNIAAKGLSGEGYEGHYFWDTEIYMLPMFLMTHPEMAKKLLLHRYSLLDSARERAKEVGHKEGALFPWRTITGTECSAFFPAGTAQYHISADIAYSFIQYDLVTGDEQFFKEYSAEVLMETARLWLDTGHFYKGEFRIDNVTGPDEYTCIVNNNFFTNVMAQYNLEWAKKAFDRLKDYDHSLIEKLGVTEEEAARWEKAARTMYLPYDEERGINPQDDTFLQKAVWDFENTPSDHYPLLLNYHPLTLYRYQVCKQADTILAHFLLEDTADEETIARSYDYYEKVTTHDSSLSYCVFSIMAAKLGKVDKAYDYFMKTARLDLDNTHGNTKDGLHMANMGGTWLAIVFGFGGVRVKESGLSFAPNLPKEWGGCTFHVYYQGNVVQVEMEEAKTVYTLVQGNQLAFNHKGQSITATKDCVVTVTH